MKQIDMRDLPGRIGDEPAEADKYIVVRNGEVLGHFLPRVKRDLQKEGAEAEAFRRHLSELRGKGWIDPEIIDTLERTLPMPGRSGAASDAAAMLPGRYAEGHANADLWPHASGTSRKPGLDSVEAQTATLPERRIAIDELPEESDDRIRTGVNYVVERDGHVVGYFVPRKNRDREAIERDFRALDQAIERALQNGYTREQLAEDLDLSKPFREDL